LCDLLTIFDIITSQILKLNVMNIKQMHFDVFSPQLNISLY